MSPIQLRQKLESFWHAKDVEVEQVVSRGIFERDSVKCVLLKLNAETKTKRASGSQRLQVLTAHQVIFCLVGCDLLVRFEIRF